MNMSHPDDSAPSAPDSAPSGPLPDTTGRAQPSEPDARILDELTDGYAYALALDAECLRLLQRITAMVAEGTEPSADELGRLSRRLRDAQRELAEHRQRLTQLRAEAFRDEITLRRSRQPGAAGAPCQRRRSPG
jgi:hypothetical protein